MRGRVRDLVVAAIATAVATGGCALLHALLGADGSRHPFANFFLFFLSVLVAALFGGLRPALVATVLGLAAGWWFTTAGDAGLRSDIRGIAAVMYVAASIGTALWIGKAYAGQRKLTAEHAAIRTSARDAGREREVLRITLASIGDAVITTDVEARVTYLNAVATSITGWEMDDARGRPLDDVFHVINEDTGEMVRNPALRALAEGAVVGLANHSILIARDGRRVPIDDSAAPIRDDAGNVTGSVLIFRDISERRRGERSRALLASIVEGSDDAIVAKDLHGVIQAWNAGAERLFGWAAAEMVGKPITMLIPGERIDEETRILERLSRGERIDHFETVRVTKDGRRLDVSLTISPLRDRSGRIVGASKIARDVTARKKAQEDLHEQRELLRVTLESIGDGVIATDAGGRVTFLNPVAEELTGWSGRDAAGQPLEQVFAIVNEETRAPVENPAIRAMAKGLVVGLANHTVLLARDGTERAIDDSAAPIRTSAGEIKGSVLIFRDVTERRRIERENAERGAAARFLAAIVESSEDAIIGMALDGTIQSWNDAAERLYGCAAEDAIGSSITRFIPPERYDEEDRILERLRRGERVKHFDTMRRRADGRLVQVSLTISPVRDEAGAVVGISKTARDITARMRAERLLRLASEVAQNVLAADDPNAMVRGVFDRIRAQLGLDMYANYVVDEAGRALKLASHEGIPEAVARAEAELSFGSPIAGVVAARGEPIHAARVHESSEPMYEVARSIGLRAYVCFPLLIDFRPLGTLAFASRSRDEFRQDELDFLQTVTRYVTIAYERLRLIQELRQNDRRKDEFLATLAHELRNPLAPMSNMLETLKRSGDRAQMLDQALLTMERQMQQLVRLVDDLLDVGRITRNRLQLRKERVEFRSVVQQAVDAVRPLVDAERHALTVELPAEPILLEADPVRLSQVFVNLLGNACKYTPPGGRIHLAAERQGSDVVVSVADTGIGIPPERIADVFEMFAQVQTALEKSQGGLGIGLTLVKRLVEMHGGSVEAYSEGVGRGSRFVVRLPVVVGTVPAAESAPRLERKDLGPGRRILVVDDNRDSANSLAMLLRITGHTTRVAHDGPEALRIAEEFRPDVMLLDIGLPKMNGYDVCRQVRLQPWGAHVVLVALTGWGQDDARRESRDAGFDHHLVKPVDYPALERILTP